MKQKKGVFAIENIDYMHIGLMPVNRALFLSFFQLHVSVFLSTLPCEQSLRRKDLRRKEGQQKIRQTPDKVIQLIKIIIE